MTMDFTDLSLSLRRTTDSVAELTDLCLSKIQKYYITCNIFYMNKYMNKLSVRVLFKAKMIDFHVNIKVLKF